VKPLAWCSSPWVRSRSEVAGGSGSTVMPGVPGWLPGLTYLGIDTVRRTAPTRSVPRTSRIARPGSLPATISPLGISIFARLPCIASMEVWRPRRYDLDNWRRVVGHEKPLVIDPLP
jgi:hypothetical protein